MQMQHGMSALGKKRTLMLFDHPQLGLGWVELGWVSLLVQPCRTAASQKILARRREYIDHLTVLVAPTFVLGTTGDHGDASTFKHALLLVDAEFHFPLKQPHELLVWMRMGGHMRSGTHLPPHHHALLSCQHPARNLVGDFFLRDRRKRPETR